MKYFITLCAALLFTGSALAQKDTLKYDGIANPDYQPLFAVTDYPIEAEVCYTTRFTPTERCRITHLLVAGSIVRFSTLGGNDTLVVTLYDDTSLPLKNIYRTWYIDMGRRGFPNPNITSGNPLQQSWHGTMVLPLDPQPIIAPARDFLLGVSLKNRQSYPVGDSYFHGLTFSFIDNSPEYERYRRYQAFTNGKHAHKPAGEAARYALYMRAIVEYDPSLQDTDYTGTETLANPAALALHQNYPNPFTERTTVSYTLSESGYVSLAVYDMLGRKAAQLAEGRFEAGTHSAAFNAAQLNLAPGMYIMRLRQGNEVRTRNMFLMK